MAEDVRERFQRFSAARVECPLCGSTEIEYDFVVGRAAFSSCGACRLLLSTRGVGADAPLVSTDVPLDELLCVIPRYLGREPRRYAVLGPAGGESIAGLPIRADLDAGERFDAILVLERIPGEDPLAAIESIAANLEPDGVIAFLLPSTSSALAQQARNHWPSLRSGSRFFFCPDNAQLLATRAGFGDFVTFVDAFDLNERPSKALRAWFRSHFVMLARPIPSARRGLLSVIFPVYNEADTVAESLQRVIDKEIPGIDVEIVVVESNSTDGSREVVERFRGNPRVRVIHEDRPQGKGHAVRTGLAHARGEVILFQDADLEYDVNDYDKLVAPLFELRQNVVLGSRHDEEGAGWKIRSFTDQPLVATVANLAHVALLRMFNTLYDQRLRDPFTMYKVFRRDALYGLTFECNRFDFDYEIVIKLLRKGYQIEEIPVNYTSRSFQEGKKVSFFGDPPTWVRAMLRFRNSRLYPF